MLESKKRKLLFSFVLIVIVGCVFASSLTVSAGIFKKEDIPIPTVQKDVYVYDVDNIIDDEVENKINNLLIKVEDKTSAEIAVITVTSLLDYEIEDYSYKLANTLGIGKEKEDNGVLLLISKKDSRVRLEIGKGLEGCLNDSRCGRILDNYFVPYREKDEYTEGTYKTVEALVSVIAKEYETTFEEIDQSIVAQLEQEESEEVATTLLAMGLILLFCIIVIGCDSIFFDGILLSGIAKGMSSGGSSGGSGGFGGGSFGGGGASR